MLVQEDTRCVRIVPTSVRYNNLNDSTPDLIDAQKVGPRSNFYCDADRLDNRGCNSGLGKSSNLGMEERPMTHEPRPTHCEVYDIDRLAT
jgi:hypothetical protein